MDEREKKQIQDFYNKNAKVLVKQFDQFNPKGRKEDVKRAFWLFDKGNPKVMEIGCGNGREAEIILKYTNDYLGVDISKEMIKLAKKRAPKGRFWISDVEKCLLPNGLDIVFAFASLLHFGKEAIEKILTELYKRLNINGIVYLSLKYGEYRKIIKNDMRGMTTIYTYTPELIQILAGDRFRVIYKDFQEFGGNKWFTIILQK